MEPKEKYILDSKLEEESKPKKVLRGMPGFLEMREDKEHLEVDKHPQYLMMNLETSCPFRCPKCAQPGRNRKMGEPLTIDERENVLDTASQIGAQELVIIGAGEPTLPKNFEEIIRPVIEAALKKGMGTIMFTTAMGIDKEQAEFYRDHDVTIFVSLDSFYN